MRVGKCWWENRSVSFFCRLLLWRFAKTSKYGFCTEQNIHWSMICLPLLAKNIDADGDHCVINDQWIRSARRRVSNKISLNQRVGNEPPHSLSFGSTYPTKVSHNFYPVGVSPKKIHSTDLHCSVLFYTTFHSTSFCLFFGEVSVYGNLVWICCWSWHKARKL